MRLLQPDKLLGISPLIVLLDNSKNCNLRKWPISGGISFWKVLFSRVKFLKKLKFPTCGDMEPTSFRDCRSNTMTLWCRRPQVTPCHWQKWMLSFQELITWRGSWVILALNASSANRSVSLFPPTTEVTNRPKLQRRIKVCMQKAELRCESPMQCGWWSFVQQKCWEIRFWNLCVWLFSSSTQRCKFIAKKRRKLEEESDVRTHSKLQE